MADKFKRFLRKIERTSEDVIRKTLLEGMPYVDTPGFYHSERSDYHNDVVYFYEQVAPAALDYYLDFFMKYPKKVNAFLANRQR